MSQKLLEEMDVKAFQYPIGALASLNLQNTFILVGESNRLSIIPRGLGRSIISIQIFTSQAIHGIVWQHEQNWDGPSPKARILLWGGCSMVLLEIRETDDKFHPCALRVLSAERRVNDWVLDAFLPKSIERDQSQGIQVVAITAKNEILTCDLPLDREIQHGKDLLECRSEPGPRSILFSAHVISVDDTRLLVAAGTVTGEILVWSTRANDPTRNGKETILHHKFIGHEGSVFGVRMAPKSKIYQRDRHLMVSCSDDRSIRLWDISAALEGTVGSQVPEKCLGSARGHVSRIWSVRFLPQSGGLPQLLSFGEDGTTQRWQISIQGPRSVKFEDNDGSLVDISHLGSYEYHSGKHIWGIALEQQQDETWLVATGGADGRIASYCLDTSDQDSTNLVHSETKASASRTSDSHLQKVADPQNPSTLSEVLLNGMVAAWKLSRTINSKLATLPSGRFEGEALVESRETTDVAYDLECLYSEHGEFISDSGHRFKARRQYVYRYRKANDEVTAWFVKPDGQTVDSLFHILQLDGNTSSHVTANTDRSCNISANGHHLCEKDTYDPQYNFEVVEGALRSWQLAYTVRGPNKDYTSNARFEKTGNSIHSQEDVTTESPVPNMQCKQHASSQGSFKAYAWVSERAFIATTDTGHIFLGKVIFEGSKAAISRDPQQVCRDGFMRIEWTLIDCITDLMSTSILTALPHHGIVLLSGKSGKLYGIQESTKKVTILCEGDRKIGFIQLQDIASLEYNSVTKTEKSAMVVLRRLGSFKSELFYINLRDYPPEISAVQLVGKRQPLENATEFVTTSSYSIHELSLLIEGSRHGDLRVWQQSRCLRKTFPDVHSKDAITAIIPLPMTINEKATMVMLTTGRDGRLLTHILRLGTTHESTQLETIHASSPPMGTNVEGAYLEPIFNDLIVWGFTNTDFIVWNESTRQRLMSFHCGGAHRNWAFLPHHDGRGGSFVCNKTSACLTYYQPLPSHRVFQYGGHGREMKSVAVLPSTRSLDEKLDFALIATGAEDTTIRLARLEEGSFKNLAVLTGHNSGIQGLYWSQNGHYLFSCAGIEELYAWRIRVIDGQVYAMRRARCPQVTPDGALRVMDLTIVETPTRNGTQGGESDFTLQAVYSDSSTRSWHFLTAKARFTLLSTVMYKTCVLTQVENLASSVGRVCTSSSDGHLELWGPENVSSPDFRLTHKQSVHQSSIHSLVQIKTIGGHRPTNSSGAAEVLILLTGGDDQAIGITRAQVLKEDTESFKLYTLLIPNAHASAVTSIALAGSTRDAKCHRFVSVGTDQRLKTWVLEIDSISEGVEGMKVKKVDDIPTGVADASSLSTFRDGGGLWRVVVVGVGMECRTLKDFG